MRRGGREKEVGGGGRFGCLVFACEEKGDENF